MPRQYGQYVDTQPGLYDSYDRVSDEGYGSINFGAQNRQGYNSLDNWREQAAEQDRQNNPQGSGGGFMDSLRSAYGKTPALDEYRNYLKTSPQSGDYKPNWLERIASGLAGASVGYKDPARGVATAMEMNRSKYKNALSDYYAQAGPLKEAAGIERESQTDRVKALLEGRKSQMDYLDYERNMTKDERDYLIATGKLKVDQGGLALNERKFGQETYDKGRQFGLDEREYNSLDRYRKGQLGIQGYNAKTNRMDTDSLIGRRADQTFFDNMDLNAGDTVSAGDIGRAEKDALGSMAGDYPPGTLEYNVDSDQWYIGPNVDANTRATIQAEAEKRAMARTRGSFGGNSGAPMNFGGTYNPNPPGALPNFGPSQSDRRGGGQSRYGGRRE